MKTAHSLNRDRCVAAVFLLLTAVAPLGAQPPAGNGRGRGGAGLNPQPLVVPMWEGETPGALGNAPTDRPILTAYRPAGAAANGTAVIIAPGGGYGMLASVHEGVQEAYWFSALGVTAFVLEYRLGPRYHHPVELGDAQRAIRMVRHRAKDFNLETDRIGMMGFSAGGHLAATTATHFDTGKADAQDPVDRESSRPDFLILGYPVISFQKSITHAGSVRNLLGDNPDPALINDLSNELHVTAQTPPTFIVQGTNDGAVPVENSVEFYSALHKAKVPVEMHLFENGPHGFGMALTDPSLRYWTVLLQNWMTARGLLTRPAHN